MAVPEIRRLYYSMKDVCGIVQATPHMLKTWEKRFPQLKPAQNKSGKRLYKPDDIQLILRIRDLLGHGTPDPEIARILEGEIPFDSSGSAKTGSRIRSADDTALMREIKQELVDLLDLLKK